MILLLASIAIAAMLVPARESKAEVPPAPIDPNNAEQTLLNLVNSLPINNVQNALDHFPVPYVACATANAAPLTCTNQKAGSPTRIDADKSKSTGQGGGGQDIQFEVNTVLLPSPHLTMTITRLGTSNFASNLEVFVAFPFDAFNPEDASAGGNSPNLFFGYRTTAPFNGSAYPAGGVAPLTVTYDIVPHILAGPNHALELAIATSGASNPIQFLGGHFDGAAGSAAQDVLAVSALADPVPATMSYALSVSQNLFSAAPTATNSNFALTYGASSPAKVIFNYFENETLPLPATPDFGTQVTFDQMPTADTLTISTDFAARKLHVNNASSAPIGKVIVEHRRRDGLEVTGTLGQLPTSLDVQVDFAGSVVVNVGGTGFGGSPNPNTMDVDIVAKQNGGFPNTSDFLGYPIGYAELFLRDTPDFTAGYIPDNGVDGPRFGITATNPGEYIGAVGLIIDDDGTLQLPSNWNVPTAQNPAWHEFSLIDDGTHGTAAARVVDLRTAAIRLDASPTGETFDFILGSRSPLQLHLETTGDSQLTGEDIKVVCEVENMPMGDVNFEIDFPNAITLDAPDDPAHVINSLSCAGNVGTLHFDTAIGQLPVGSGYLFDPNGKLDVTVGTGNGGYIGFIRSHLWDEVNPLPFSLLPSTLMDGLHDATMRVDHIPTFTGTWSDGANSAFSFAPADSSRFVDGVQILVSTVAAPLGSPLPVASPTADDFLTFEDNGAGLQRLGAGVFGLKSFSFASDDANSGIEAHYRANAAHTLIATVDTRFGGRFFPNYDIDLTFTIADVPAEFDLVTEFDPHIQYTGSGGIGSITLNGTIDDSGPGLADKTTVALSATGLPDAVTLDIDPDSGASLLMSSPLTQLNLKLTSNVAILGGDYQLIRGQVSNVPPKWNVAWGGNDFLLESKNADDTPSALGPVTFRVSRSVADDASDARLDPFKNASANRIGHSAFQSEIDTLYWPASVNTRLDRVYNQGEKLDAGEDHVVVVKNEGGEVAFVDGQFTGFQKILIAPSAAGGDFEFNAPSAGVHPLFGGLQEEKADPTPDKFTLVQVADIPDHQELHINIPGGDINYSASGGAGKIDLYQGPLPAAADGQEATRAVMNNTPSSVHITWDFGLPNGHALFDASNTFDIDFLTQDGSQRIVAGLTMQDVELTYGIDILSFDELDHVGVDPCELIPLTDPCPIEVPIEWELLDFGADLVVTPGLDGFIGVYDLKGGLQALAPSGTTPDGDEYIPFITGMAKDSTGASAHVTVSLDPIGTTVIYPVDVNITIDIGGQFIFDVWSNTLTDEHFTFPVVDIDVGIINTPDYITNNPFHIFPLTTLDVFKDHDLVYGFNGFHTFGAHFDPFGP